VSAVSNAPLSSVAVAAIRWQLPLGVVPSALSLTIAGSPPPFVTVEACQVTSSFAAVYGGAYAEVPSYSCDHPVDGVVKGGNLVFAGIGKLASGSTLSILLLPGGLDRVVFAPPSLSSLVVSTAQPSRHRLPSGGAAGSSATTTSSPGGGAAAAGPGPLPPVTPAAPQAGPAASPPPPVVAGPGGPAVRPAALSESLPGWRRWLAASVIALEVAVFIAVQTRRGKAEANPGRGIGRFVAERESAPIRL
jgi:hypothetical protein